MFLNNKNSKSSGHKQLEELDLYDAIIPLYIISKIVGLAPFTLKGRRGKRKFVADVGTFVFIRIICILGAIAYVAYLLEAINLTFNISGVAIRCELYLGAMLTAVVLFMAITNQTLVISSVRRILQIDRRMKNAGFNITYKNARKFCIAQNVFMFSVFLMKGGVQAISSSSVYMGKKINYVLILIITAND